MNYQNNYYYEIRGNKNIIFFNHLSDKIIFVKEFIKNNDYYLNQNNIYYFG